MGKWPAALLTVGKRKPPAIGQRAFFLEVEPVTLAFVRVAVVSK